MNIAEQMNREKKAARLAAVMFRCGGTAEDVLTATPVMWEMCAEAATQMFKDQLKPGEKVHPPNSTATVYAVVEALTVMYQNALEYAEAKIAQQESDEAAAADDKAEAKWEESQEYAGNRCPERE